MPAAGTIAWGAIATFHVGVNAVASIKAPGATARATGLGDTKVGLTATTPSTGGFQLAVDYTAKLPTASSAKGLGSGFVDHQLTATPSLQLGANDNVSADFGVDLVGTGQSHDSYFFTDGYFTRTLDTSGTRELDLEVDYTPAAHGSPADCVLSVSSKLVVGQRKGSRSSHWTIAPGLTAGLVSSSSGWGGFVSVTYANARTITALAPSAGQVQRMLHILGLGLSGSRR